MTPATRKLRIRTTKTWIDSFEYAIATFDMVPAEGVDPIIHMAMLDGLTAVVADLRKELAQLEAGEDNAGVAQGESGGI